MIRIKISAFVFGFLLLLAGCEKVPKDGEALWVYKDYLVDGYLSIDQLKITTLGGGSYRLSAEGAKILKTTQDAEELARFEQLAALHGGRVGRKVPFSSGMYREELICYDEEIVEIDVSCDVAWDDAHPAGSSLRDMCQINALSVAPFVRSPDTQAVLSLVYKRLNLLRAEDMEMLIDGGIHLVTLNSSQAPSKRTLTFQLRMKSGRVFTAQVTQ